MTIDIVSTNVIIKEVLQGGFMRYTRHAEKRIIDRGISKFMVDMAYIYGTDIGNDRVFLGESDINEIQSEIDLLLKEIEHIKSKGGITLAISNNSLITAFLNYRGRNERDQKWRRKSSPK